MKLILLLVILINFAYADGCSPYFNPNRFYDAPEYLEELLKDTKIDDKKIKFTIQKNELYKFSDLEIANEINGNFKGFWSDWIEDGYEMQLVPEDTLFKYQNNYLSLSVYIYGVKGDATKLKTTTVKYEFYNYTKHVNEYIKCQRSKK